MTRFPNNPHGPQRPVIVRRRQPRRRQRLRLSLLAVPALLIVLLWVVTCVEPVFTWDDVMDHFHIRNRDRYTMLAVLGVLACCVCAIARILRADRRE